MGALLSVSFERPKLREAMGRGSAAMAGLTLAVFVGLRVFLRISFTREGNTPIYNALSYTLVAMIAFWCIAYLLTHSTSLAARVLSWRPLVRIGQISYGLYLYHTIVLSLLLEHLHLTPYGAFPWTMLISLVLASSSFRFIESPLIGWGRKKSGEYRRLSGFAAAQAAVSADVP